MKKKYSLLLFLYFSFCIGYGQNFGELASGISINNTIYNTSGSGPNRVNDTPGALSFDGISLGTFSENTHCAKITASEVKTWKNNTGNVCNAVLNWRVYLASTSPSGSFNTLPLLTVSDCDTTTSFFMDGLGTCSEGGQKWKDYGLNVDFINSLAVGNYILEIYFSYTGSDSSTSTCETTKYINNSSANYKATFTVSNPTTNPTANATSLCEGTNLSLSANPSGGVSPYTFSWTGPNGYTATDENPIIINTTVANSGSYSVTVIDACGATSVIQTTAAIVINPKPNVSVTNTTQTICSTNSITTITPSGTVASTTYNWTRDQVLTVTGIPSSGNGNISGNLTNTTNTVLTVTFTITPSTNTCIGTSIIATIQVEPSSVGGVVTTSLPNASPVVKIITVCHSASGSVYLSGQIGNVVRWESSVNGGFSWTDIGNANASSYTYTNILTTTLYRAVIQSWRLYCKTKNS